MSINSPKIKPFLIVLSIFTVLTTPLALFISGFAGMSVDDGVVTSGEKIAFSYLPLYALISIISLFSIWKFFNKNEYKKAFYMGLTQVIAGLPVIVAVCVTLYVVISELF